MTDLGKSTYEGEKDIAVQKDLYAAVMEALTEIIRSLNPNYSSNIDIQKGQGLTVERKSKNLTVADVIEVQKKPSPEPIPTEQPKEPAIKTLYGGGISLICHSRKMKMDECSKMLSCQKHIHKGQQA
jgi:hypothetical protein